jgi:hypothetical protein
MVIVIKHVVQSADTGDQGEVVFSQLRQAMMSERAVVVSFEGIRTATSSFVNTAFVQLLSSFTLAEIKERLRVINSTRQINDMIRTRLEREAAGEARLRAVGGPSPRFQ